MFFTNGAAGWGGGVASGSLTKVSAAVAGHSQDSTGEAEAPGSGGMGWEEWRPCKDLQGRGLNNVETRPTA